MRIFNTKRKYYVPTAAEIRDLAEPGNTAADIAKALGASQGTVKTIAAKHGIKLLGKRGRPQVPNPVRTRPRTPPKPNQYSTREQVLPDPFNLARNKNHVSNN